MVLHYLILIDVYCFSEKTMHLGLDDP